MFRPLVTRLTAAIVRRTQRARRAVTKTLRPSGLADFLIHVAVTREPSDAWTAQQLRQVTPFGEGPDVIIRNRGAKFGAVPPPMNRLVQTPELPGVFQLNGWPP